MNRSLLCAALAAALSGTLVGCAGAGGHAGSPTSAAPIPGPADVPAALQPPSGQAPIARLRATGVQIYECTSRADAPGGFAWQFKAPEATLADEAGHVVGHHFAGPTWTTDDGSSVVGQVSASAPSPRAGAIAWLLLTARSRTEQGLLQGTTSVQRLETAGGVAPAAACGQANAGQVERVGYSATYVFWRTAGG
jgi:hypothetical protein